MSVRRPRGQTPIESTVRCPVAVSAAGCIDCSVVNRVAINQRRYAAASCGPLPRSPVAPRYLSATDCFSRRDPHANLSTSLEPERRRLAAHDRGPRDCGKPTKGFRLGSAPKSASGNGKSRRAPDGQPARFRLSTTPGSRDQGA